MHPRFDPYTSRLEGLADSTILNRASILCIGVGGVVGALEDIAALGARRVFVVDPERVGEENVATQRFSSFDVGRSKAEAAASHIRQANPSSEVITFVKRDDEMESGITDYLWKSVSIVWCMADDPAVQARANKLALKYKRDVLFGGVYLDSKGWELGGTLAGGPTPPETCYRCVADKRLSAYESGERKRPASVSSHRLISNRINEAICWVTLGLLHMRAGSDHWCRRYGEEFADTPFLVGNVDLDWHAADGQWFGDRDASNRMFATRHLKFARPSGWTCPDCGKVHP